MYFIKLTAESEGNQSSLWKHLNSLTKRTSNQRKSMMELNVNEFELLTLAVHTLPINLISFFIQSIKELEKNFESVSLPDVTVRDTSAPFHIKEADQDKIGKMINKLINTKAKDMFVLDTALIKKHSSTLIRPITRLVNLSIRAGKFPQIWKTAIITRF